MSLLADTERTYTHVVAEEIASIACVRPASPLVGWRDLSVVDRAIGSPPPSIDDAKDLVDEGANSPMAVVRRRR